MFLRTCFALCALMSFLSGNPQDTDFSQRHKPSTIKVLLSDTGAHPVLEVKGRHYVYNPADGTQISSGLLSKRFPLKVDPHGIHWGEKFPAQYRLRFVPGDSQSSLLVNGIQYKGCIEVYLTEGTFNLVNEVDVEHYLKASLSSEFPKPGMHPEAMNALAIVARTHIYSILEKQPHSFWHVTARDVGYQGAAIPLCSHVVQAVDATYHAILTYHNHPFSAAWTHHSGGKTVNFASIFRRALETPQGVESPHALETREKFSWVRACSKEDVAKVANLADIQGMDLYVAPESSKVYAVKLSDATHAKDFDFVTFQRMVGKDILPSNDFKVTLNRDELIFSGYGEGLGTGLCLYSAHRMAEEGKRAPEILSFFFPDTSLEKRNRTTD